MIPYIKIRTVEDLKKIIKEFPSNMKISRINCDGSTNASTRFFVKDGILTFGFEGRQVCKLDNNDLINQEKKEIKEYEYLKSNKRSCYKYV